MGHGSRNQQRARALIKSWFAFPPSVTKGLPGLLKTILEAPTAVSIAPGLRLLPPLSTKIRIPLTQLADEFLRYVESISPLVQFFQEIATLNHHLRFAARGSRVVQSLQHFA